MEADASALDMPIDCCYFVDKAAAANAAPAFQYFDSIFHHFAVVTQNLGQTEKENDAHCLYLVLLPSHPEYSLSAPGSKRRISLSAAQGVALKALIDAITIPTALPNPNALTFTGAVSGSYDGSAPLEVEIPSGGAGLTVTNTAAVGQTVKITAVDENGQPTEWEAVDMPSGGGGTTSDEWIDLGTLTLADGEEATNFSWKVNGQVKKIHIEGAYYSATSGKNLALFNSDGLSGPNPLITYSVFRFPSSANTAMYMDLTVEELYPGYWFGVGGASSYNNPHENTIASYGSAKRVDSYLSLGAYWRDTPLTAGTWFNVKVVYY